MIFLPCFHPFSFSYFSPEKLLVDLIVFHRSPIDNNLDVSLSSLVSYFYGVKRSVTEPTSSKLIFHIWSSLGSEMIVRDAILPLLDEAIACLSVDCPSESVLLYGLLPLLEQACFLLSLLDFFLSISF